MVLSLGLVCARPKKTLCDQAKLSGHSWLGMRVSVQPGWRVARANASCVSLMCMRAGAVEWLPVRLAEKGTMVELLRGSEATR